MTSLGPFIDAADLAVTAEDRVGWATSRIREYCGWHISPSITSTVIADSDGGRLLVLPTLHLTGLTSLTLADDTVLDLADVTWDASGTLAIGWNPDMAWNATTGPWPVGIPGLYRPGYGRVTVVFTHGHPQIPDALREVAVGLATRMPAQMTTVDREAAGGVMRIYGGVLAGGFTKAGFTAAEQAVCDRYRLPYRP